MIAYVETNFLLEVAYLREGYQACEAIMGLALSKAITLVLPGFCVTEARMAWQRQAKQRSEVNRDHPESAVESRPMSPDRGNWALWNTSRLLRHFYEIAVL